MILKRISSKSRAGLLTVGLISAIGVTVFNAPAHATWEAPIQENYWDRQNYACDVLGPGCNTNSVGINGLAVTPDGTTLLSSETNLGRVQFLNAATGAVNGTVTVGSAPQAIVVNSSGTTAYVTNANDRTISVIDIATLSVTNTVAGLCAISGGVSNLSITPNNSYLIQTCTNSWSNTGTAFDIIETATNNIVTSMGVTDPVVRVAIDPSSNFFWGASRWGTADATTGNTNIALNGDGSILYVLKDLGAFSAWTNLTTTPTKSWQVAFTSTTTRNVGGPTPLVVDNTNKLAYFVTENCCSFCPEVIEIVDLDDESMLPTMQISHQWAVNAVLSPDGTKLFTAGRRFSDIYTYGVARPTATTTTTTSTTTTTTTSTTTTTLAPTTTSTPATTTTVEDEESPTTTADQQERATSESLPPTGGRTSQQALPVLLLLAAGLNLIVVARSRQVRA
jgi:YVTN family beta-propeller protein